MIIELHFDNIDDADIEIQEIDAEMEETLLQTLLAFCNRHFEIVKDEE